MSNEQKDCRYFLRMRFCYILREPSNIRNTQRILEFLSTLFKFLIDIYFYNSELCTSCFVTDLKPIKKYQNGR